jgi:late competence protein required for DNA uptake (superfamily II DNA/RNA helicase)
VNPRVSVAPWEGARFPPRRWQAEALDAARASLAAGKRSIIRAATGAGKTAYTVELARLALARSAPDERVVITVPTTHLVEQTAEAAEARPLEVGMFYGQAKDIRPGLIVCCNASLAPLAEALRNASLRTRLLICDEVHSSESPRLIAAIPAIAPRWRLGLTATPFRGDDRSLSLWDDVAYRYLLEDARRDGVLVPWQIHHTDRALDTDEAVRDWLLSCHPDLPAVASARSIDEAKDYAKYLELSGIRAQAIHSKQSRTTRRTLLDALRTGALRCLVHVSLLAEGVDLPWLVRLAMRRPVSSPVRIVQEFGRVLRSSPGKDTAHVFDPHGLLIRFGLGSDEAIGKALDGELPEDIGERKKKGRTPALPPLPFTIAIDRATSWIAVLANALEAASMLGERPRPVPALFATDWHIRELGKLEKFVRYLPEEGRIGIRPLLQQGVVDGLSIEAADLLIAVLRGVRAATLDSRSSWVVPGARPVPWRWPSSAPIPALDPDVVRSLRLPAQEAA